MVNKPHALDNHISQRIDQQLRSSSRLLLETTRTTNTLNLRDSSRSANGRSSEQTVLADTFDRERLAGRMDGT